MNANVERGVALTQEFNGSFTKDAYLLTLLFKVSADHQKDFPDQPNASKHKLSQSDKLAQQTSSDLNTSTGGSLEKGEW